MVEVVDRLKDPETRFVNQLLHFVVRHMLSLK